MERKEGTKFFLLKLRLGEGGLKNYIFLTVFSVLSILILSYCNSSQITMGKETTGLKVERGSQFRITWQSTDAIKKVKLNINLIKDGKQITSIAQNIINEGKYFIKIPFEIASGEYQVEVEVADEKFKENQLSSTFEVTNPKFSYFKISGDGKIERGSRLSFRWNSSRGLQNVKLNINLMKEGKSVMLIAKNHTNKKKSLQVTLPFTLKKGLYQVKIETENEKNRMETFSEEFEILDPKLIISEFNIFEFYNKINKGQLNPREYINYVFMKIPKSMQKDFFLQLYNRNQEYGFYRIGHSRSWVLSHRNDSDVGKLASSSISQTLLIKKEEGGNNKIGSYMENNQRLCLIGIETLTTVVIYGKTSRKNALVFRKLNNQEVEHLINRVN